MKRLMQRQLATQRVVSREGPASASFRVRNRGARPMRCNDAFLGVVSATSLRGLSDVPQVKGKGLAARGLTRECDDGTKRTLQGRGANRVA